MAVAVGKRGMETSQGRVKATWIQGCLRDGLLAARMSVDHVATAEMGNAVAPGSLSQLCPADEAAANHTGMTLRRRELGEGLMVSAASGADVEQRCGFH